MRQRQQRQTKNDFVSNYYDRIKRGLVLFVLNRIYLEKKFFVKNMVFF